MSLLGSAAVTGSPAAVPGGWFSSMCLVSASGGKAGASLPTAEAVLASAYFPGAVAVGVGDPGGQHVAHVLRLGGVGALVRAGDLVAGPAPPPGLSRDAAVWVGQCGGYLRPGPEGAVGQGEGAWLFGVGDVHRDRHGVRVPVGVGGGCGQGVDRLGFVVQNLAGGHHNLSCCGVHGEAVASGDGVGDLVPVGVGGRHRFSHGRSARGVLVNGHGGRVRRESRRVVPDRVGGFGAGLLPGGGVVVIGGGGPHPVSYVRPCGGVGLSCGSGDGGSPVAVHPGP